MTALTRLMAVLLPGANFSVQDSSLPSGSTHLALQNEVPLDSTIAYLHLAKAQNVTTFFNPSPMPSQDELRVFPWNQVDWLLLNQGEAVTIAEAFAPATADETAESTLQRLRKDERFAKVNLVCTLGANGVIVSRADGQSVHHPAAALRNPLKDTTGAGDCFTGYFVAGLMRLGVDGIDQVLKECLAVSHRSDNADDRLARSASSRGGRRRVSRFVIRFCSGLEEYNDYACSLKPSMSNSHGSPFCPPTGGT